MHVEFEYNNLLEPNPTWDAVLQICDFDSRLLRSKNEKSNLSHANFRIYSSGDIAIIVMRVLSYISYLMSSGRIHVAINLGLT